MGREIRRVPIDWEHPMSTRFWGESYSPLIQGSHKQASEEWIAEAEMWHDGTHPDIIKHPDWKEKYPYYWMWSDPPPAPEFYMPDFGDTATAYQMYENVSEGTPVSPVFETLQGLEDWLVDDQGYSRKAAQNFCKTGWVPSMVIQFGPTGTAQLMTGVEAAEYL